jgi:plasmid stabilization system protein ParE
MSHRLVFSPEALEQLAELYRYIAQAASPSVRWLTPKPTVSDCENF